MIRTTSPHTKLKTDSVKPCQVLLELYVQNVDTFNLQVRMHASEDRQGAVRSQKRTKLHYPEGIVNMQNGITERPQAGGMLPGAS